MLVGPVIMSIAMGMLATIQNASIVDRLRAVEPLGSLVVSATELTPYVLVIGTFSLLYAFVPNAKVRIRTALIGGVLAEFVAGTDRTVVTYSGFAIVIFGMLWLYFSWLILLLGAQFTFYYQNRDYLRLERRTPNVSTNLQSVWPST